MGEIEWSGNKNEEQGYLKTLTPSPPSVVIEMRKKGEPLLERAIADVVS